MICGWLLPMLDLERHLTVIRGQPPPVPGLGSSAKDPGHPETYHHLPAVHKAQPLRELQVVKGLTLAGSPRVTSVRRVVQIQI